MGTRVTALVWAFSLAFALLGYRFYDVQLNNGDLYEKKAEGAILFGNYLTPKRGSINFSDKNGRQVPAAINKEYPTVNAVPSKVTDPVATAVALNSIVEDMTQEELVALLSKTGDPYEPLIKRPTEAQIKGFEPCS